jgi:hypothetical protein
MFLGRSFIDLEVASQGALSRLIRCVCGFPFYAAAGTCVLHTSCGLSRKRRIGCCAKVHARHGDVSSRTAGVELTSVNEPALAIKKKEFRRAHGLIRFGNGLGFIEKVGEAEALRQGKPRHGGRTILRIRFNIVRADGNHRQALGDVLVCESYQASKYVLHIGAVIADERDEQRRRGGKLFEAAHSAIYIGQGEGRRL